MHITKTTISGDGSVRREMRFRTQSADSRVTQATQRWVGCDEIKEPMGDSDDENENGCFHCS